MKTDRFTYFKAKQKISDTWKNNLVLDLHGKERNLKIGLMITFGRCLKQKYFFGTPSQYMVREILCNQELLINVFFTVELEGLAIITDST